jgi:hypothetical protein
MQPRREASYGLHLSARSRPFPEIASDADQRHGRAGSPASRPRPRGDPEWPVLGLARLRRRIVRAVRRLRLAEPRRFQESAESGLRHNQRRPQRPSGMRVKLVHSHGPRISRVIASGSCCFMDSGSPFPEGDSLDGPTCSWWHPPRGGYPCPSACSGSSSPPRTPSQDRIELQFPDRGASMIIQPPPGLSGTATSSPAIRFRTATSAPARPP